MDLMSPFCHITPHTYHLPTRRVEGERFVVQSPGYPAQYDHNLECRYTVVRRDASVCGVQLMVESFSVENGTCMFDYLEVQGQRLCGTLQPTFTREDLIVFSPYLLHIVYLIYIYIKDHKHSEI